jgi:hypothetical protein
MIDAAVRARIVATTPPDIRLCAASGCERIVDGPRKLYCSIRCRNRGRARA